MPVKLAPYQPATTENGEEPYHDDTVPSLDDPTFNAALEDMGVAATAPPPPAPPAPEPEKPTGFRHNFAGKEIEFSEDQVRRYLDDGLKLEGAKKEIQAEVEKIDTAWQEIEEARKLYNFFTDPRNREAAEGFINGISTSARPQPVQQPQPRAYQPPPPAEDDALMPEFDRRPAPQPAGTDPRLLAFLEQQSTAMRALEQRFGAIENDIQARQRAQQESIQRQQSKLREEQVEGAILANGTLGLMDREWAKVQVKAFMQAHNLQDPRVAASYVERQQLDYLSRQQEAREKNRDRDERAHGPTPPDRGILPPAKRFEAPSLDDPTFNDRLSEFVKANTR